MEPILIEGKDDTPMVILNKEENKFEITGKSLPENVTDFYGPIFDWLEKYVENPNDETVVEMKIEYFNSASHKAINQVFETLANIQKSGKDILVKWYFLRDDDDMLESGHDYADLTGLEFEYIGYE
jgi:Holliday junction resolvase RusA-like endonuclease